MEFHSVHKLLRNGDDPLQQIRQQNQPTQPDLSIFQLVFTQSKFTFPQSKFPKTDSNWFSPKVNLLCPKVNFPRPIPIVFTQSKFALRKSQCPHGNAHTPRPKCQGFALAQTGLITFLANFFQINDATDSIRALCRHNLKFWHGTDLHRCAVD